MSVQPPRNKSAVNFSRTQQKRGTSKSKGEDGSTKQNPKPKTKGRSPNSNSKKTKQNGSTTNQYNPKNNSDNIKEVRVMSKKHSSKNVSSKHDPLPPTPKGSTKSTSTTSKSKSQSKPGSKKPGSTKAAASKKPLHKPKKSKPGSTKAGSTKPTLSSRQQQQQQRVAIKTNRHRRTESKSKSRSKSKSKSQSKSQSHNHSRSNSNNNNNDNDNDNDQSNNKRPKNIPKRGNNNSNNSNNSNNNNDSNNKSKHNNNNNNNNNDGNGNGNGNPNTFGLGLTMYATSENNEDSYVAYSDYEDDEDEVFNDTLIPLDTPHRHGKHNRRGRGPSQMSYKKRKSAELGLDVRKQIAAVNAKKNKRRQQHKRGASTNNTVDTNKLLQAINSNILSDQDSADEEDVVSFTNEATLLVFVEKGRNLPAKDIIGNNSDSYVVVTVGDKSQASKKITSLNPEWNAIFQFRCKHCNYVIIDIYDNDRITSDDEMGRVIIPIADVHKYKEFQWCRLTRKSSTHVDKLTGDVYVKLVFAGDEPSFANQTLQMNVCYLSFSLILLCCLFFLQRDYTADN